MNGHVLVTGAAGRIGSTLVPALIELGWKVRATDVVPSKGIEQGDCNDKERMRELVHGMDAVIHLAGCVDESGGWQALDQANVQSTLTLLDAAYSEGVKRFVLASSIHVVGAHPADTALTSDMKLSPDSLYGVSKVAAEALLSVYAFKRGMTCVAVRVCTYAPAPRNARELKTWLSPFDCAHLFDRTLLAPIEGFHVVWGVSANSRLKINDPAAKLLGYDPKDNGEAYALRLQAAGADTSLISEWAEIGGRIAQVEDLSVALLC